MNIESEKELLARDMNLRDWFAGQALAGGVVSGVDLEWTVRTTYEIADAMLAKRASDQ